jgi:hypothetical protein
MEGPENSAAWFILHDNARYGPFTVQQLKEGALDYELHPRYDMAWQEGMADWIPAGEVEGLFEKIGSTKNKAEEHQDYKKTKKKKRKKKRMPRRRSVRTSSQKSFLMIMMKWNGKVSLAVDISSSFIFSPAFGW